MKAMTLKALLVGALVLMLSTVPTLCALAQDYLPGMVIVTFSEPITDVASNKVEAQLSDLALSNERASSLLALGATKITRVAASLAEVPLRLGATPGAFASSWVVSFPEETDARTMVEAARQIKGVSSAELVGSFEALYVPSDPSFSSQWGYNGGAYDVNAAEAWDYSEGGLSATGLSTQKIAIIDTGIMTDHFEWTYSRIADSYNSWDPYTELNLDEWFEDDYGYYPYLQPWVRIGHGTSVTGICLASNDNDYLGGGMLGGDGDSNTGSSILRVKANYTYDWDDELEEYVGTRTLPFNAVANGFYWAVNNGAAVINFSAAGETDSYTSRSAVVHAYTHGVPVVVGMGNEGDTTVLYPASYWDAVITVGANWTDGSRAVFTSPEAWGSSIGDHIDVVAPTRMTAASVVSTGAATFEGTSCSTPFVTGIVGMIKIFDPTASPAKVEALIRASGLNYPVHTAEIGFGVAKADKALDLVLDEDVLTVKKPVTMVNTYCDGSYEFGGTLYWRWRVEFSFNTNKPAGTGPIAVWVEPTDHNGSPFTVGHESEMENAHIATADPTTFEEEGDGSISGRLATWIYVIHNGSYVTVAPSSVEMEYTQMGEILPSQVAITDYLYQDGEEPSIGLEWARLGTDEELTRYEVQRADGPYSNQFYWLAYRNQTVSGTTVSYEDRNLGEEEAYRYKVRAEGPNGWGPWSPIVTVYLEGELEMVGAPETDGKAPKELTLDANYPNPFNPTTQIRFGLVESGNVRLRVFNTRGQLVRTLVDKEMPVGWHKVEWDGRNDGRRQVASGIYLYVLEAEGKRLLRRMTLMR